MCLGALRGQHSLKVARSAKTPPKTLVVLETHRQIPMASTPAVRHKGTSFPSKCADITTIHDTKLQSLLRNRRVYTELCGFNFIGAQSHFLKILMLVVATMGTLLQGNFVEAAIALDLPYYFASSLILVKWW